MAAISLTTPDSGSSLNVIPVSQDDLSADALATEDVVSNANSAIHTKPTPGIFGHPRRWARIDVPMLCCRCVSMQPGGSQNRLFRHQVPPLHRRVLVRPSQQRVVIHAEMITPPTWPCVCLAFKSRVRRAHNRLAQIVKAVRGVVRHFVGQIGAAESGLEMLHNVGLMKRISKDAS